MKKEEKKVRKEKKKERTYRIMKNQCINKAHKMAL